MQIKTKIVSSQTVDSKPVKQEVNGTVILPTLVFPAASYLNAFSVVADDRVFDPEVVNVFLPVLLEASLVVRVLADVTVVGRRRTWK